MNTNYKAIDDDTPIVAEPATVGYATQGRKALSISIPDSDIMLAHEMIQRMGWTLIETPQSLFTEKKKMVRKALKELRGCISLPANFDYKNEIHTALTDKHGRS